MFSTTSQDTQTINQAHLLRQLISTQAQALSVPACSIADKDWSLFFLALCVNRALLLPLPKFVPQFFALHVHKSLRNSHQVVDLHKHASFVIRNVCTCKKKASCILSMGTRAQGRRLSSRHSVHAIKSAHARPTQLQIQPRLQN